jgi:hypothetical protein
MNAFAPGRVALRAPSVVDWSADPYSMRVRCLPLRGRGSSRPLDALEIQIPAQRRRHFLRLVGGSLLVPWLVGERLFADEAQDNGGVKATGYVSQDLDPAKLWDGDKQLVFAYKQGETLGEACQRLEDVKSELPVSILWRLPPDWVKKFPTVHFEVSSRRWKKYESWESAEKFIQYYGQFNPPPKSAGDESPFKSYAAGYKGDEWTYPGKIRDHLLDPEQPHQFSEYELRGLSKQEMENLHSAHHEESVSPGRRPPQKRQASPPEQVTQSESP